MAAMEYGKKEDGDLEQGSRSGSDEYPMVLIQIPMCNEREVSRCGFSSGIVFFYEIELRVWILICILFFTIFYDIDRGNWKFIFLPAFSCQLLFVVYK